MNILKCLYNQRIPMRDGVQLSADIYFPEEEPPYYVLLIRTPYDSTSDLRINFNKFYTDKGYCVVLQDVRGRGDSDGIFSPWIQEENDSCDTIKWISKQSWCKDKSVAMTGGSYHGFVQWEAAKTSLPELKAIAPAVIGHDRFKDGMCINGIFCLIGYTWQMNCSGRSVQHHINTADERILSTLPIKDLDKAAGCNVSFYQESLKHPVADDYWQKTRLDNFYKNINIPVFITGGWYDKYAAGCFKNFMGIKKYGGETARKASRIIIGPWNHSTIFINSRHLGCIDFGKGRMLNPLELEEKWLAQWFKNENSKTTEEQKAVTIFLMGENTWREETDWPLPDTQYKKMFLASSGRANSLFGDGKLNWNMKSMSDKDTYIYNPENPVPALGSTATLSATPEDQRPVEKRDDVLVYTSEALKSPLEITGFVNLELYAASSAVDTDFFAKFCDVHPDGRSINLSEGIIRARFKEGLDREVMMQPGKVYLFKIEIGVTSILFKHGHRIRLEISSSCFPAYFRNLNTGEPFATGTKIKIAEQTIYPSAACPSCLILPVIPRSH
ncbi:MAG: hypothetical protein A2096_03005 [Spirochaetes bacterium GWF1_41_5]|nr:MAG: hypothetical protein A2096_03005 [Spirochaetes bacterium GWF1_41_5]